jgi:hypothetical protein
MAHSVETSVRNESRAQEFPDGMGALTASAVPIKPVPPLGGDKKGDAVGRASACLERDDFSSNRHPALASCLCMIFSENRYPPRIKCGASFFGIMH